jgi:hypothetical protein
VSKVESDLRNLLMKKAEEATGGFGFEMPARVRRRVRVRQAAVAVLSATVIAVTAFGGVTAISHLRRPASVPSGPVPNPSTSPTFLPLEGTTGYVLASDNRPEPRWKLVAYRGRGLGELCLAVIGRRPYAGQAACDFGVPKMLLWRSA